MTATLTAQADQLSLVYKSRRRAHKATKVIFNKLRNLRTRALKAENRRRK